MVVAASIQSYIPRGGQRLTTREVTSLAIAARFYQSQCNLAGHPRCQPHRSSVGDKFRLCYPSVLAPPKETKIRIGNVTTRSVSTSLPPLA